MFLNKLSLSEKESFISLAIHAAEANHVIVDEEYAMIEEYCKEMGIAYFDARNVKSLDEITRSFAESTEANKKIVLLETIGLMYADGTYDDEEKNFVENLASGVGVDKSVIDNLVLLLDKYVALTKEIMEIIS
ncbi:Tellurite resistance protein TerB [Butyrivibrio sp. ob235]|uniref:tellurite resistance TerB family protein n=1 Tax=Butyrivibrio sp. ob235 TaxID=1761780 RepID=UPI0008C56CC6|nr:TerB family tellurite resistance protein [Butyrivibrio sp. ob235]SEM39056.1 Tellurite resistance protein TerB [Butyrivibrio sp. ob235]